MEFDQPTEKAGRTHMDHQLFEQMYQGQAPWDTGEKTGQNY